MRQGRQRVDGDERNCVEPQSEQTGRVSVPVHLKQIEELKVYGFSPLVARATVAKKIQSLFREGKVDTFRRDPRNQRFPQWNIPAESRCQRKNRLGLAGRS